MKKFCYVLLCGSFIFGTVFCYYRTVQAQTPVFVEVTTVKRKDIYNSVIAPGTIDSVGIYDIVFAGDTFIHDVAVSLGQSVKQGDLLMKRKTPEQNSMLFAKEISNLTDQIISAVSEYGIFLENNVSIPTVFGSETSIISPVDGVVTELNVSKNETIQGLSVAAKITDYSNFQVTVDLSEIYLSTIAVGQSVDITCDAFPQRKYKGQVTSIANSARKKGSLLGGQEVYVPIRITLKNADENLKPGYSVNARICTEKHENTLVLPYKCIFQDEENRELVYVVNDGVLELRRVISGLELEQETEIIYGLKSDDKVVENPSEMLKTGQKVSVKE